MREPETPTYIRGSETDRENEVYMAEDEVRCLGVSEGEGHCRMMGRADVQ